MGIQMISNRKVRIDYYDGDEGDTEEANDIVVQKKKSHASDQGPRAVRLLSLMKEHLPCHQELQFPTELPKPQESIKVIPEHDELHQTTSNMAPETGLVSCLVILFVSIQALFSPLMPSIIN